MTLGEVIGHTWQASIDVQAEIGLMMKGEITIDKAADIIAERLKLLPQYGRDAELKNIIDNLQSLPATDKDADFWSNMDWLADWGDHGRRLFIDYGPVA